MEVWFAMARSRAAIGLPDFSMQKRECRDGETRPTQPSEAFPSRDINSLEGRGSPEKVAKRLLFPTPGPDDLDWVNNL